MHNINIPTNKISFRTLLSISAPQQTEKEIEERAGLISFGLSITIRNFPESWLWVTKIFKTSTLHGRVMS